MDEARSAPHRIATDAPILFLYGEKDQVIPREPTEDVVTGLSGHVAVIRYPHGYHMLLRDLDGETVWKDVADVVIDWKRRCGWYLLTPPRRNRRGPLIRLVGGQQPSSDEISSWTSRSTLCVKRRTVRRRKTTAVTDRDRKTGIAAAPRRACMYWTV